MSEPAMICVAITGSLPTKADNPAVPIKLAEQVESAQAAWEAGAAIAHCHIRDDEGRPTSDPERFGRLLDGLRAHCPRLIVQVSTGGHLRTGLEDNLRLDRDTLATSNAALVRRAVEIAARHRRRPATAAEAGAILGLSAA